MMITTPQGAAIDTDNVARVKHVYGYNSKRAVRVYFYDFDGACEYLDPDGKLYEAFKKAGISASNQPSAPTPPQSERSFALAFHWITQANRASSSTLHCDAPFRSAQSK